MNKKVEYETKPLEPTKFSIAEEKKIVVPNKCVLGACGEEKNLVRTQFENIVTITCLKCGYVAKFIDGKII